MSNVDNRMRAFYSKGYQAALADVNSFMDRVGANFSYLKFNDKITAKDFMSAVMKQLNETHGYIGDTNGDANGT